MATAMTVSLTPSDFIQSAKSIGLPPAPTAKVAPELPPAGLSEVLAVLVSEIVSALPIPDREGALVRIANRLDDLGRLPGGNEGAAMLGAVADVLMRLEG
ncbi:hypothetical protein Q8W71_17575 [Methylobacterium sp. NEAU 140]|uniref:hypothetical protein n=1 Tax=Methylobacterium sp. NEAU 140 TaxID=3064945 RepID=UPI0027346107|nr:hypothetical protein [Methylobacterium sp. NEAU 140]MDP4024438.1 hypothetical protein [Methylobacterium sp. NEAU 140]